MINLKLVINDEKLLSAFAAAQGLINSRPLTYQSVDACDVAWWSVCSRSRRVDLL